MLSRTLAYVLQFSHLSFERTALDESVDDSLSQSAVYRRKSANSVLSSSPTAFGTPKDMASTSCTPCVYSAVRHAAGTRCNTALSVSRWFALAYLPMAQLAACTWFRRCICTLAPLADEHDAARFLKARNYDLHAAKAMWEAMLAWRREMRADTIHEWFNFPERDAYNKIYPTGLHQVDREVCSELQMC